MARAATARPANRSQVPARSFRSLPPRWTLATFPRVRKGALPRGLDDLRREGLVETRQGAGTFACRPPEREPSPESTGPGKRLAAVEETVRQLEGRLEEVERLVRGRP